MRKAMLKSGGETEAVVSQKPHEATAKSKFGPKIADCVDAYKLRSVATKSVATANNRAAHLDPWQRRMALRGVLYIGQLTTDVLLADLAWLRSSLSERTGKLRSDVTIASSATVVLGFLSREYDLGNIDKRLLSDYEVPKGRKASVYNPTAANLNNIFSIIDDYWDPNLRPEIADWPDEFFRFFPVRLKTLVLVQMTTAFRIGSTCHLALNDWDRERKVLTARVTKSGNPIDAPVLPELEAALDEWLKVRPKNSPSTYLFVTELGTQMNPKTITQTFRRYQIWGREHGYDLPRITLHSLRHYIISKVAGESLDRAQELAGHAEPRTTKLYVHTTTPQVRDAVEKSKPLEGIIVNKRAANKRRGGTKPRGQRLIGGG